MRKVLIAVALIAALFASCQKESDSFNEEKIETTVSKDSIVNGEDKDNGFRWLTALPRTENNVPIYFADSDSEDNQNLPGVTRTQIVYNKTFIDSVIFVRQGTFQGQFQYSVPNGNGGSFQPIVTVAKYKVLHKLKTGVIDTIGDRFSKLQASNIYKYKPSQKVLVYSSNTYKWTKITRPTSTSQVFYSWFYGMNKTRFLYNIKNSSGTSVDLYLDPNTGGSAFILNHSM